MALGPDWRRLMGWLFYAVIAYVLLLVVAWAFQTHLLYLPDRSTPSAEALAHAGLRLWPELASAEGHRGLIGVPRTNPARGTIVVFHGNAGAAFDRQRYIQPLQQAGFRVVLAEYPGYGGRGGAPSEDALVTDGVETMARLRDEFGDPVYVWGESLGAGVAAAVAGRAGALCAGVVLLTPWDTLRSLARHHYWYLPTGLLVRDRYDSIANLSSYPGPIALLVAERDRTVPPVHGRHLYEALQASQRRVRLWQFPQAGHNDWPDGPGERWWREVIDFTTVDGLAAERSLAR